MDDNLFTIRDIQPNPADLEALLEIEQLSFGPEDVWSLDDFNAWLRTNPDFCIVADADGRILSSILGRIQRYRLNIGSCATHPAFRRRGIATALLRELEKRAKAFSIHQIDLEVRPSNTEALAFWLAMGFEQFKTSSAFYPDGEDALLMHKKI